VVFRATDGAVVVNASGDPVDVGSGTAPVGPWSITVVPRSS
jgi:hypothetical protein